MTKWKIAWYTENRMKRLKPHIEPTYFRTHEDAARFMKALMREIEGNPGLHSKRQVVKMYYGIRLTDTYDSRPLPKTNKKVIR